jgi:hypothetical protein
MTRRPGELSKSRKLQEWPHHVRLPVPENGFGRLVNDIHAQASKFDCTSTPDCVPGHGDAVLYCFRREPDAAAFKAWCAAAGVLMVSAG